MKKRFVFILTSLFSLSALVSCNNSNPNEGCDDMFEDCGGENSSSENKRIDLQKYSGTNYQFDEQSTNENGSVSYEIFVRSFYDSDGDKTGDFNGVKEKLPYLADLGIKTIWLMPIMPSPSYHGYDVKDYYDVNPDYGTMDDFIALTEEAEKYHIDVMIDIVFNHSSAYNQWFIDSHNDYVNNNQSADSKADWYVWSQEFKTGFSRYGNVFYESRFDSSMPDFNTENEEVRQEMVNILKFWVDRGVDGFRFDAVKYFDYGNTSYNSQFLTYLKEQICEYKPSVYFVGECWDSINVINNYYTSKCDSFFKFNASLESNGDDSILRQVKALISSNKFGETIESQERILKEKNPNGYSSYFLSNHDMDRASNSFTGYYAKMAASLTYLLPGTPFMYYGEEIMLKGKRNTTPDDLSDAKRRLPMIWSKTDKTGECQFPERNRLDLDDTEQVEEGVLDAQEEGFSLLNHYKKVINIRNKYPFLKQSIFTNLTNKVNQDYDHVLAYKLSLNDDYIIVIHNFETKNVEIDVSDFATEMLDEVSCTQLTPELSQGKLKIGRLSTVILK